MQKKNHLLPGTLTEIILKCLKQVRFSGSVFEPSFLILQRLKNPLTFPVNYGMLSTT